jgi:hypothetical protein
LISKVEKSSTVKAEAADNISDEPVAPFFKGETPPLNIEAAGSPEMLEMIYDTMSHPRRC